MDSFQPNRSTNITFLDAPENSNFTYFMLGDRENDDFSDPSDIDCENIDIVFRQVSDNKNISLSLQVC